MKTEDKTLIEALEILSRDIQSDDGIANACILEAAQRLRELTVPIDVEALQKENEENCRLLGMSAEREIQLLQKVQQLEDQVSCLVQNSESQTQTQQALIKKLHRLLPDDLCPQDDKSWQQSDAFGRIEYLVAAHKSNRDELKMV